MASSNERVNGISENGFNKQDFEALPNIGDTIHHFKDLKTEPIAIVGYSLKFPQDATSPQGFWKMMVEKRDAMTNFPIDRANIDAFYRSGDTQSDGVNFRGGHFVKDPLGSFDAPFFTIPAAEAASMDPMHRFVLESAYHALENAGLPIEKVSGSKTSVFAGCSSNDYYENMAKDLASLPVYGATGVASSMLATRLSWFFNFHGPSINLDTACSSSMVAFDLAVKGLQSGDSDMSLVVGANLIIGMEFNALSLARMNFFSQDSRCYSFDQRANGYGRGEGVGVLVLKRVSDALRNGDTIRAVVRSTASNQDGYTPGITVPSRIAQEDLIRQAYARAGLDLKTTRYVEGHGTGTPTGDPIEATAIGRAFRNHRTPDDPIYIGAVKSNIGHLEGGSGVAGIIKTILVLETGIIPPNANYETTNEDIDEDFLRIKFPRECTPWPCQGLRRASINSFGFGGSNSHIVLEDAYNFLRIRGLQGNHATAPSPASLGATKLLPEPSVLQVAGQTCLQAPLKIDETSRGTHELSTMGLTPYFCLWSSADKAGLERMGSVYESYFREESGSCATAKPEPYLSALSYTLLNRRSILPWKSFAMVKSVGDLRNLSAKLSLPIRSHESPRLGCIFTGQGAQSANMGSELLKYPIFKNSILASEIFLNNLGCKWLLTKELQRPKEVSNVNQPEYSQALCTAIQIALIDLLRSFGFAPSTVVGHSSGEIAAAYCVGGLSQQAACKVAYLRGQHVAKLLISDHCPGAMISINLSEREANEHIQNLGSAKDLVIACINSQDNVTISGPEIHVDLLKSRLDKASIFNRKLAVNVAYHSPQMEIIAADYLESLGSLESGDSSYSKTAMVSSVTTNVVSPTDLQRADYWTRNLTSPVRFADALSKLCISNERKVRKVGIKHVSLAVTDILEIGPHSTLQGPIKSLLKEMKAKISYSSCLERSRPSIDCFLEAIGHLYCHGYPVDIRKINKSEIPRPEMAIPDLPQYPFDHSRSYWHESRLSTGWRFRKSPRVDLLGAPDANWNPMEARWRNHIRISELPWTEGHRISGSVLYPASGMVVMAIEAARQLADGKRQIDGFTITDAVIRSPIPVPADADGVETEIHLRSDGKNGKDSVRFNFVIYTYMNGNCTKNCHGIVQVGYKPPLDDVDFGKQNAAMTSHYQRMMEQGNLLCDRTLETEKAYSYMEAIGLCYGEDFRAIDSIRYSQCSTAIGRVQTFRQKATEDFQMPIIHPVTLDTLLHLNVVSISRGTEKMIPTMIPTRVGKLWIAGSGIRFPTLESVDVFARSAMVGYRKADGLLFAIDQGTGKLLLLAENVEATVVATMEATTSEQRSKYQMCYNTTLNPDLDLLSNQQLLKYCEAARPSVESNARLFRDVNLLILISTRCTLKMLNVDNCTTLQPHIPRYIQWLKDQQLRFQSGTLPHLAYDFKEWMLLQEDSDARNALYARLQSNKLAMFYLEICHHLPEILSGQLDPLTFMFKDELLPRFYKDANADMTNSQPFIKYLETLCHNNPNLKIIEIGAGTGATTNYVVDAFSTKWSSGSKILNCAQYDYTDISPAFFDIVSERYPHHEDKIKFKVLDIEQDPSAQGFKEGTYDVVIAAYVLHATKNLDMTMMHVRKLLKTGGKALILETTEDTIRIRFATGLLPGWWRGEEDYRINGGSISYEDWHTLLRRTGFSGVDVKLPDYKEMECQEQSILISTAVSYADERHMQKPSAAKSPTTSIVVQDNDPSQRILAQELKDQLQSSEPGINCSITSFESISKLQHIEHTFCIVLVEIEKSILSRCTDATFTMVKRMLTTALGIIWVTGAGSLSHDPRLNLIDGLSRSARTEHNKRIFITLGLDNINSNISTSASKIWGVFQNTWKHDTIDSFESEIVERDGLLHVPRIIQSCYLDEEVGKRIADEQIFPQPFGIGPPLELSIGSPGLLDSLRFVEDTSCSTDLAPGEVEVKVEATGVNFRDCLTALGQIDTRVIGAECAGIVTRVTENCEFKPGDRVFGAFINTYRTYARGSSKFVSRIPATMSFAEASAVPVIFMTAWHALHDLANVQAGESILIHAGAGGTGQASIQVAKLLGAEVYTTVGSKEKKDLLMKTYDIPEDHILYSRNTSFAQGIKNLTLNRGVDVVLNSLSGDSLIASWDCVAPFGRFIEIGKHDIMSHGNLPMGQFSQPKTFCSVDLLPLFQTRPHVAQKALQTVVELFASKKLHLPQPFTVYGISQLEEVLRLFQSGHNLGKMVVEMRSDEIVQTLLPRSFDYRFDENASYLIAGGLGGLGRTIALWMASRGARNLILPTRSGPRSEVAIALVKELVSMGVHVDAEPCDISDKSSLEATLTRCARLMPPIKGCIAGAMVLRDNILEKMTVEDWNASLDPKVDGSWNLHTLLPKGMDFFICLSSTAGVLGGPATSNYAAGNTYLDALAEYRILQGEKATGLDLGWMKNAGVVAENADLEYAIKMTASVRPISQEELYALLDYYCNPALPFPTQESCRAIIGLETPAAMRANLQALPEWTERRMFRFLHQIGLDQSSSTDTQTVNYGKLFREAASLEDAAQLVTESLVKKLSKALSLAEEDIDTNKALNAYGVDSLLALELRNYFNKEFGAEIPVFDIAGVSFNEVGVTVTKHSKFVKVT